MIVRYNFCFVTCFDWRPGIALENMGNEHVKWWFYFLEEKGKERKLSLFSPPLFCVCSFKGEFKFIQAKSNIERIDVESLSFLSTRGSRERFANSLEPIHKERYNKVRRRRKMAETGHSICLFNLNSCISSGLEVGCFLPFLLDIYMNT